VCFSNQQKWLITKYKLTSNDAHTGGQTFNPKVTFVKENLLGLDTHNKSIRKAALFGAHIK